MDIIVYIYEGYNYDIWWENQIKTQYCYIIPYKWGYHGDITMIYIYIYQNRVFTWENGKNHWDTFWDNHWIIAILIWWIEWETYYHGIFHGETLYQFMTYVYNQWRCFVRNKYVSMGICNDIGGESSTYSERQWGYNSSTLLDIWICYVWVLTIKNRGW